MNATHIRRTKGFTLIELMVVVGIIAITMGIGLPNFQSAIASSRLTSSANGMVTALVLARSQSVKGNIAAGVCINLSSACPITTSSWYVFSQVFATSIQQYSLDTGVALVINTGDTFPTYRPDGRLGGAYSAYAMTFSTSATAETRYLTISSSGQVNVCTPVAPSTTC